ncbi:hypothetical protein CPB85DRAFT_1461535 [Mucidula mucida]|nr:hypothetical protein CPB85DRAFT_1461535 [Mucidula mucida]
MASQQALDLPLMLVDALTSPSYTDHAASSTGPLVWKLYGGLFNWALMGVLCVQLYLYTLWYFKTDRKRLVGLVYGLFVVELAQTALTTHTVTTILVSQWGDFSALAVTPWSAVSSPITGGIVACIVQLFFAWRIKTLGSRLLFTYLSAFVALVSLTQCAAALAFGIMFASPKYGKEAANLRDLNNVGEIWVITAFCCDTVIALILTYILWTFKSTMMTQSGNLLNTIIIRTIQSGTITAVVSCCHIILFLRLPMTYLHLVPLYTVGKLYSNILLANLNGRQRMKAHSTVVLENSYPLPFDQPGSFCAAEDTVTRGSNSHGTRDIASAYKVRSNLLPVNV